MDTRYDNYNRSYDCQRATFFVHLICIIHVSMEIADIKTKIYKQICSLASALIHSIIAQTNAAHVSIHILDGLVSRINEACDWVKLWTLLTVLFHSNARLESFYAHSNDSTHWPITRSLSHRNRWLKWVQVKCQVFSVLLSRTFRIWDSVCLYSNPFIFFAREICGRCLIYGNLWIFYYSFEINF